MEIKLEVLASTCIKQKKPWPQITWLGQEKEAVYLLDEKNINEINLLSGKTKKIPQLYHLMKNVILLTASTNGSWLAGILTIGELFLWNKDHDSVKIVSLAEEVKKVVMATHACSRRFFMYISGDGNYVLVTTPTICVFLWENMKCRSSSSKNPVVGQWSQIVPEASIMLPPVEEKESALSAEFVKTELLGDRCLCSFAYFSEENLVLIFLEIKWQENTLTNSSPHWVHWTQQRCCLTDLTPCCEPVKSKGALLTAFSHDGLVLAVGVNQKDLQASQILFMNTTNFVTVSGSLKGCGAKNHKISSKLVRSYWIADMSWTPDSLFLACMLKRGSLILMSCLGELLTLVTFGCSIEFGPAEFIPLHPLITYRSCNPLLQDSNHSYDSSASEGDLMRQRFSVTSHSNLPCLITSDGYIVTVLRFSHGFSPSAYMRSLLLDSAQRLEKLRHNLIMTKSKEKRLLLQSLSSVRANLLQHQSKNSSVSAIPKFLQEEKRTAETNGETTWKQDYTDESDDDKMFQSHSFTWGSTKTALSLRDEGRLEFASMFDTIHAVDSLGENDDMSLELNCIQKNLIAAWKVGISKIIQERDMLLSYTIHCITHYFNILQYAKLDFTDLDNTLSYHPWIHSVLKCFQQLLTVLTWESKHGHTPVHLMKLTLQTLKLMLAWQRGDTFSGNLLGGFLLLKIVSHYLNGKNIPQYATFPTLLNINHVELDSIALRLFQRADSSDHQNFCALNSIYNVSPATVNLSKNSEKRLIVMWQLLYKHVLWYWAELNKKAQNSSKAINEKQLDYERPISEALTTHIQAILQSSGEKLEQTFTLNSVTGEEQFLIGSHRRSVEAWGRALQEAKVKGGRRMPFVQTRYYLAILYCHLYHYNLREAQGLCDRLVSELLKRSQISVKERDDVPDAEWMIKDVPTAAVLAVVQCLARFMAAYFTNEPLFVLPPHSVDILPPLHFRPDPSPRVIPLEHSLVTNAIRHHGLSGVWTVEYALDLLLVGGLIPEAVWLTHKLGDWKMAVSVGVAFNLYCQNNNSFPRSEKVELCLPSHLTPTHIFQEKLQSFLGQNVNNGTSNQGDSQYKQLTDPIEEEDACVLFSSVEEILKAAVMAEADIVSETFLLLVGFAKELSRKLNGLVPDTFYLPAPPLYCPQPAFPNEEEYTDLSLTIERNCRQKVSGVIQRILLLFRAAHCSLPAAQWYIVQLKRIQKIMQKIHKKVALPPLSVLPENLLNYSKYDTVLLKPTSSGDHRLDDVSCKTIACFRELCALCWMLHVREMLSHSCRRYQTAREKMESQKECKKTEFDPTVVEYSLTALEWANRMLPFARFMNIEELVQDIILSLIGELPPIKKVAEILVKAFPNPEDVRVPLRDKYSALQQRLQHCIVKGPKSEEMMSNVIQTARKVNAKTLKCVIRNIGPYQKSIWDPPEEEAQDPVACCCDNLSLGTSLSRSTVSDLGNSQFYNDAETTESVPEVLLVEETKTHIISEMQENHKEVQELIQRKKTAEKLEDFGVKEIRNKKENNKDIPNQHVLPLVGEWEFERDDDEYLKFLNLFLTYILERDLTNHRDSMIPFLVSFSPLLREHELNSFLFDVHTTLKRRQIRNNDQNVFRAGSCFTTVFESIESKSFPVCDEKKKKSKEQTLPISIQEAIESSDHESVMKLSARKGLFGLSQQPIYSAQNSKKKSLTPVLTQRWSEQVSSVPQEDPIQKCIYKVIQMNDITHREEPTPEMKFKFNNVACLLEWMIRWSDKRLLYYPISRQPLQDCQPKMHVKISASAIITSLWLLEYYSNNSEEQNTCFSKMCKQSTSTYSSTLKSKIEEDSRMDTGCFPSTGTPIGIQESCVYGKPYEDAPGTLQEKQSEKKDTDLKYYSVTDAMTIRGTDFNVGLTEEMGEFTPSKVEVTYDNEDYCEDPFAVPRSPTISVSIKSVQQKKEQQSLLNIQFPQADVLVETLEENSTKLESTAGEAILSSVPCSFFPEMKKESPRTEITISDHQPSITVVSSVLSSDPSVTKNEEVAVKEPTAQPLNISDAVREMLQDEMFKLVQLQQINFMSLMQIVGSSFANLPNMSQQMEQAQPFQLEQSRTPNPGGTGVGRAFPRHPADGFLKTQMTNFENRCHGSKKNINPQEEESSFVQQNHNGYDVNHPHTSASSSLPENQSSGKRQIPPFQCLLHQLPARQLPLLSTYLIDEKKPKLIPLAKNINNADGLPLLKLKPQNEFQQLNICPVIPPKSFIRPQPQRRECWDSLSLWDLSGHENGASGHLNLNNYNNKAARQTVEQKNNRTEALNKGAKCLHLDKYGGEKDLSLQDFHAHLRTERSVADSETCLQKTYENFTQFPLLYLKPWSRSKCPSALITVKYTGKDTESTEPCGQSALPLLCSNLPPPIKFQIPKLIPLQNITAFEQSHQVAKAQRKEHQDYPGCIHLLKADIKSLEIRQDRNDKKRQKRRIETKIREKKERKKTAVTFQQDDSVDLADTEKQTKDNQVTFTCDVHDVGTLFKRDTINVAELHYLASVSKNPVELQDASTNTDTVHTSHQDIQALPEEIIHESGINQPIKPASTSVTGLQSHQDMQTIPEEIHSESNEKIPITFPCASNTELLPSCVPLVLPPDLYLNLTFPTEAAEKPLSSASDITSDLTGQKYISVVDIENGDDLKNLPDISEPSAKAVTFQAVKTELPTAAKLHHMAASVTNVIPPEKFKKEGDIFQNEPFEVLPATVEAEIANDPLTLRFLHEDFSINSSTEMLARKISKKHLSAKLQEMDRQLLTLQNVAERMDKEFHSTKLLVETIEDEDVIAEPGNNDISFFAPGVKVTKEEHYSIHKIIENSAEEGDLETESFQASYIDLPTPPVSPSVSAATLQIKKSSSDVNYRPDGMDDSFSDWPQMTGLSGVSDIIAELIAEGGISASELGLTERQAEKISRHSGEVSKYSCKMKRDKKELQDWMKRKRKERLAEYMETLTEQRAKEHNPFPLRKNTHHALSTQDIKRQQKKKNEKDKALFSEHHNRRVSDALVLMHDLLSDTVRLPSNDYKQNTERILPRDFKRPRIASVGSYYGSCQSPRKTFTVKAGFNQTRSSSSLFSDITQKRGRVCQAPYKRMLSGSFQRQMQWKSSRNQKQCSSGMLDLQSRATHQTKKLEYQRNWSTAETATQASEESDDDALSIWSIPDEIQKILYSSSNLKKDSLSQEDGGFIASLSNFDSVSESTSSILSKLDWNAVEAMVANVEEK